MSKSSFSNLPSSYAVTLFTDKNANQIAKHTCHHILYEANQKSDTWKVGDVIPHFIQGRLFLITVIQEDIDDYLNINQLKTSLKNLLSKCEKLNVNHIAFPISKSGNWNTIQTTIETIIQTTDIKRIYYYI